MIRAAITCPVSSTVTSTLTRPSISACFACIVYLPWTPTVRFGRTTAWVHTSGPAAASCCTAFFVTAFGAAPAPAPAAAACVPTDEGMATPSPPPPPLPSATPPRAANPSSLMGIGGSASAFVLSAAILACEACARGGGGGGFGFSCGGGGGGGGGGFGTSFFF